jgi:hypothetical protein
MYQVFELQREAFDASVSKMINEYQKKYVPQAEGIEAWNMEIDKEAQSIDILIYNLRNAIKEEMSNCDKMDEVFNYLKMYDHTPVNEVRAQLNGIDVVLDLVKMDLNDITKPDKSYDDDYDGNFTSNDRIKDDEVEERHGVIKEAVDEVIGPVNTEALTEVVKQKNKEALEQAQKAANEAKTEAQKAEEAKKAAEAREAAAQAKVNEALKEVNKAKEALEQAAANGSVVDAKQLAEEYTNAIMSPSEIVKDALTLGIANSGAAAIGGALAPAKAGTGWTYHGKTAATRIKEQVSNIIKGTAKKGGGVRIAKNVKSIATGVAKGYATSVATQAAIDLANNVLNKENAELVNKAIDAAADAIANGVPHDEAVQKVRDMLVEEDKKKAGGGKFGEFLSDIKAIANAIKGDDIASNARNMAEAAVTSIENQIIAEDAAAGVAKAQEKYREALEQAREAGIATEALEKEYEKAKQEADRLQAEADAIADSGAENSGGGEGNCDSSCDSTGCDEAGSSCDSNPGCDSCTRDGCRRDGCDGGCDCDRDPACGKDGICGSDSCKRETDD